MKCSLKQGLKGSRPQAFADSHQFEQGE